MYRYSINVFSRVLILLIVTTFFVRRAIAKISLDAIDIWSNLLCKNEMYRTNNDFY